jgi:hypothetical protein
MVGPSISASGSFAALAKSKTATRRACASDTDGALVSGLSEGATLDLARRQTGVDQGVPNGVNATLAQGTVVRIGVARIRIVVDSNLEERILTHVIRDIR